MREKPRILLSEGSSLSAREVITALGLAGHPVELVASSRYCLGRFSRFVRRVHCVPRPGSDPDGYLSGVLDVVARRRIDVLIPTHEQAYLFAASRHLLPRTLGVALPDFAAIEQVQTKAAFSALLARLYVPQPATWVIRSSSEFLAERPYPFFVKRSFGTASIGVWRVDDEKERDRLLQEFETHGDFAEGLVLQAMVNGTLERAQAIFDHGRLVAHHIYRQVAEGPGGGDVLKLSVHRPGVRALVGQIGSALAWHGALSFDYIVEGATQQPRFIDANPRLVEPMNAWLSGVDLTGALLELSLGETPSTQPDGRAGILTRLSLMGVLDAARRRGSRWDVLTELLQIVRGRGRYKGAVEELTPMRIDRRSALPLVVVSVVLLLSPTAADVLLRRAITAYSIAPTRARRVALPPDQRKI